jgi:hypothetical protein
MPVTRWSCAAGCVVVCSKYFEQDGRRFQRLKILEIGLGCDMGYGPVSGGGARVANLLAHQSQAASSCQL